MFAPAYGSPFVRDLENGRRYATIEDFRNFARLTHMSASLHHGGGTLCEPVDLPVNKRHFDMVFSHIKYHDRPFMGSVTAPERAQDTVDMVKILFGDDFIAANTVLLSLCNANSPMSWDYNMLGSAKVYAENNQACLLTPFILAGAMAPVTVAGTATQTLAEALAGMAFCQLVKPGAPVVFGSFASSISMQSGAPTFGTPEPALMLFVMAALARRLGVPFRSGGNLTASKVPDYQAAYESAATFFPTILAGVNFVLHTAGWLEGGLTMGYEKFILDADQADMAASLVGGVDISDNGLAFDALLDNPPGPAFPRQCPHSGELRECLLAQPTGRQQQLRAMARGGFERGSRPRPRAIQRACWPATKHLPSTRPRKPRSSSGSTCARLPSPVRTCETGGIDVPAPGGSELRADTDEDHIGESRGPSPRVAVCRSPPARPRAWTRRWISPSHCASRASTPCPIFLPG